MDNRRLHDLSKLSNLDYPISTQFDTKSNYRGGLAWWAVVITIPSMQERKPSHRNSGHTSLE